VAAQALARLAEMDFVLIHERYAESLKVSRKKKKK
jgi:hypothetical protein